MDSNTLTVMGTFIVAIISGLLAYSSSLSTKEKEIKLSAFEKLGLDAHAILESLYSHTDWHRLTFVHRANLNRRDLIAAGKQQPLNIDEIRELKVRLKFFDKDCHQRYEAVTKAQGDLIPKIYGYIRSPGEKPVPETLLYTTYEVRSYIFKLNKICEEVESLKEFITNEASRRYRATISSSRYVTFAAIIVLVFAVIAFVYFPMTGNSSEKFKEKVTLIYS